jgi:Uma2 family endonuclease
MPTLNLKDHASFPYLTMADLGALRESLGGVPAERIWLYPLPGTASEMDCIEIVESPRRCYVEMVNQTLVEKPMGMLESYLAGIIITLINNFVIPRKLGAVLGPDGLHRMSKGNIRLPDAGFTFWRFLQANSAGKVVSGAPQLVIEVLSESNTPQEMYDKRCEYFLSGAMLVWEFDCVLMRVGVYTQPDAVQWFSRDAMLPGDPVLPGFEINLTELFALVEQMPRPE